MSLKAIWRFCRNVSGNFATIFAVGAVPLLGTVGIATDYTVMHQQKSSMQDVVDAAALAAVAEMSVANVSEETVKSTVENYVFANFQRSTATQTFRVSTLVDNASNTVEVEIENHWKPFLMQYFGKNVTPIRVSAAAQLVSQANSSNNTSVCLLGLNSFEMDTVQLTENARLIANNCGVYSNSKHSHGMTIALGAKMSASMICSSGGVASWSASATDPDPIVDCPPLADPLANRAAPTFGKCDHHGKVVVKGRNRQLNPGVYCNGIDISKSSVVTMRPGTYVFKSGTLSVADNSTLQGDGVGIFLTDGAAISFTKESTIKLTAPTSGAMAGLLIYEDRAMAGASHKITSDNARILTGTIYLPRGQLKIDAKRPVADMSAYTAIVANDIKLKEGPILHLNSDYDQTDVPVPEGLEGSSDSETTTIVLKK